ncbi:MAG: GNAT family N-acetyltransferase [Actinomycetota bacterium]|nr:GNAT family N-acetyltransferase [Actinomycetota bacterium]
MPQNARGERSLAIRRQVCGRLIFFLLKDHFSLVGSGGYKGGPRGGIVEVGYEIAPGHQNQGFATEASRGMIDYACREGARPPGGGSRGAPRHSFQGR